MNNKRTYKAPAVLRSVSVQMESPILTGSVVTPNTEIETAGQKVEERNFTDSGFNSVWE